MSSYYQQERKFGFAFGRITFAVQALILVNVCFFAAQLILDIPFGSVTQPGVPGGSLMEWVAFKPSGVLEGRIWLPFTYIFLHSGLWHLFTNMLMLFFFGPDVERVLGTRQFFWFFIACGAIGVMANFIPILVFQGSPNISVVGASGAVMGVTLAFAMVDPERQIFLFPIPIPLTARGLVIFLIVMNLIAAVGNSPLSVATHFGGMAVGFVYMKYRPVLMTWKIARRRPKRASPEDEAEMKDAVNNIFKFQDRDRK